MKIAIFTIIILIMSFIPLGYSHPDPMSMNYVINGSKTPVKVMGLVTEPKEDPELFSNEWFYLNFIWILTGVITSIMLVTVSIVYKEENPFFKNN